MPTSRAPDVGDLVVLEDVDGVAEHVDAAEHGGDLGLGEALPTGGGALHRELGVAHGDLDRPTVDAPELLVHEVDPGAHGLAELGERTGRGVLLVDHPEADGLTRGGHRPVGDQLGDGGGPGAVEQGVAAAVGFGDPVRPRPGGRSVDGIVGVNGVVGLGLGAPHQAGGHEEDGHGPRHRSARHDHLPAIVDRPLTAR
jgi:hypothetical protein